MFFIPELIKQKNGAKLFNQNFRIADILTPTGDPNNSDKNLKIENLQDRYTGCGVYRNLSGLVSSSLVGKIGNIKLATQPKSTLTLNTSVFKNNIPKVLLNKTNSTSIRLLQ